MVGGKRGNHSGGYVKKPKQRGLRFLSEKTNLLIHVSAVR